MEKPFPIQLPFPYHIRGGYTQGYSTKIVWIYHHGFSGANKIFEVCIVLTILSVIY